EKSEPVSPSYGALKKKVDVNHSLCSTVLDRSRAGVAGLGGGAQCPRGGLGGRSARAGRSSAFQGACWRFVAQRRCLLTRRSLSRTWVSRLHACRQTVRRRPERQARSASDTTFPERVNRQTRRSSD